MHYFKHYIILKQFSKGVYTSEPDQFSEPKPRPKKLKKQII